MFNTFFSPTANSIPFSSDGNNLGSLNLQDAITKLAFLTQVSNLLNKDGDIVLRIGAAPTKVILPSIAGKWAVSADDEGNIVSELLSPEDPSVITYWRFKRGDGSTVAIELDDYGDVIMVNPPDTAGADINKIYLSSPGGYLYGLGVSDDGEFYTETASTPFPSFKVVDQTDQVLFSTVQHNNLALNYMPVYEMANIPLNPLSINNTMPWIFVKDANGVQKPAYFDGTVWRYFNTDEEVLAG